MGLKKLIDLDLLDRFLNKVKELIPTKTSELENDAGFMDGMTILSYGSSTWADFIAAYDDNKVVYCRASSGSNPASGSQTRLAFMAYVNNAATPTEVEFQYYRSVSSHTDAQQGDQVYVYKLNKTSGWSVTVRNAFSKIETGTGLSHTYSNGTITIDSTADVPTYSPVFSLSPGASHAITSADSGKTFVDSYSSTASTLDILLTLSQADSSAFPVGSEIALTRIYSKSTKLTVSGVRLFNVDNGIIGSANGTATIQIAQRGMAAIKKIESNTATYGDVWLLTGNAEVVT